MNPLFDLSGKIALVTGGSRGLGLEIARALGQAGAAVAITGRRDAWLRDAELELRNAGINTLALTCDVADSEQVQGTTAKVTAEWGCVDVLVNNAGVSWGAPVDRMPLDKWRMTLETNVTGTFLTSQAVGREMIRRGRGGAIVNIASVAGLVGTPPDVLDAIGYSASKGAIVALTRDLAVKWARHGGPRSKSPDASSHRRRERHENRRSVRPAGC